ncbi:protein NEOXANTHIN-DEFICIENT 1 isoform X1 [Pyrus x bretschneideri]|uniref:protein NEOXANTHIN-DEFICIENT 1 isoform X1 n=1 Tax=Pyrus x bretschneideri TaxID=225117 RepID=UPI00202F23ED|nr:protein NEOXANTHIN-DEFICIENT 1 isoform X1 [Pyrus x bretschneideri]XP_018503750.2 protein NEOXANTHIN-DEFICIENT 1 isoform X1 [Pyrus x bretschneideri]XP_048430638.1 protein NEOXANTHIN-DEFICIENT 1 isoform X1 [Pyrus x bretschneideri]XP_048430639.1 protein NEOXANTHIN-DEFICIENT 1 isoform X1 [Pyrus x bretschneideri]XP_048430640.1 protein NEOXANTHIN-DEFICIENT 1 isoform X1 [Pyrus x bretschneideri]XP_048430641.1 protein NEOXANTHIN-DEFICIENT 1 isoform X1 [Pyrus x bretschneideri]XP_048430642.1 protein 
MDVGETKCSYGKPPWIFKGSALYQLHLVKAATVRACIPKDFRLVEAFGYTLGGFFLANYDDSPAGVFDELVVIAGLVWSPPTSCAWAAKVLVNSDEACKHGRKEVGLPSHVARFSKRITAVSRQPKSKNMGFLNVNGSSAAFCDPKDCMEVQVTEIKASSVKDSWNVNLTTFVPESSGEWRGPAIKMSLPSFSGGTEYYPNLLKYSCRIECRVQAVHPAKVSGPSPMPKNETEKSSEIHTSNTNNHATEEFVDKGNLLWESVMLSKPVLALQFSCMKMQVEAPVVVFNSKNSLTTT